MTIHPYSSLTAFLAHYHVLAAALKERGGASVSPEEKELLNMMEQALGALDPADRAALIETKGEAESSSVTSHREVRAALKLRRLLAARGMLQG